MKRLGSLLLLLALPAGAFAAERSFPVVDTNQTGCWDVRSGMACPSPGQPFHGQDGSYPGRAPHYRDNRDGTIGDLVTGLVWEKAFRKVAWADASADAAASRTGGHADWRVPTIKELYSLMDFSGSTGTMAPGMSSVPSDARPYLDTRVFAFEYPRQGRFIDAQYLSATAYLGITMGRDRAFFGVNFADGRIKAYPQDGGPGRRQWYARYVRGGAGYGRNDFTDNGNGTVTDRATGLTWTKGDSGDFVAQLGQSRQRDGRLDWPEALAFCEALDHAGHGDWRLPDAKELHSILDYSRAPDVTQSAAIDPVFRISAIRDADGKRDWPYFWSSTTHLDGRVPGDFAVYVAFGKAQGHIRPGGGPGGGGMGPPGMGPPGMGQQTQSREGLVLTDVHGAGAQRSSPKTGDEARLPVGAGPQGDVLRIYNFARCVRG